MAAATGIDRTAISRIWRAFSLAPHRAETFKLSKDPLFIDKVRDIVGLYMNPPQRALDVHLILDNCATHKTKSIQNWLAKRPRFHVHFTPASASWLNLVERRFALLTERQLRRGVHRSTEELKAATPLSKIAIATQNPSSGIKPQTRSSISSPDFVNESMTQNTREIIATLDRQSFSFAMELASRLP